VKRGTCARMAARCSAKVASTHGLNPVSGARTAVPRHAEIIDPLARKICRDLGIPAP
jgi:hypothetical protein